jgi:hypothetical protein
MALDLTSLTDDGDTLELPDGRTLRLRIEADLDTNLFEQPNEAYGKVAWVERNRSTGRPYPRPDGFDGSAEKLYTSRSPYWWQPPKDIIDRDKARQLVKGRARNPRRRG